MWLDSLTPEEELATQRQQLKGTMEMPADPPPPPLIGEWTAWMYGAAAAIMLVVFIVKIGRPALHLALGLAGWKRAFSFVRQVLPMSALVLLWNTALLGTLFSAIAAGVIWLLYW